jgi:hypothetical protein
MVVFGFQANIITSNNMQRLQKHSDLTIESKSDGKQDATY